jgi:hypothetical protein
MLRGISGPKRIDFFYNENDLRDIELDPEGKFPYYEAGDLIQRRGKYWRVVQVLIPKVVSGPPIGLRITVFLSDRL